MAKEIRYVEPNYVTTNGVTIAYDEFGAPEDVPVLLIMGLGDQMITWHETFCRQLASMGFRVIRFDNRDIGLSTRLNSLGMPNIPLLVLKKVLKKKATPPYTLSDMAGDAVSVLDALDIESAHIIGASMGGMIGQVLAIEYPERTRKLIY